MPIEWPAADGLWRQDRALEYVRGIYEEVTAAGRTAGVDVAVHSVAFQTQQAVGEPLPPPGPFPTDRDIDTYLMSLGLRSTMDIVFNSGGDYIPFCLGTTALENHPEVMTGNIGLVAFLHHMMYCSLGRQRIVLERTLGRYELPGQSRGWRWSTGVATFDERPGELFWGVPYSVCRTLLLPGRPPLQPRPPLWAVREL